MLKFFKQIPLIFLVSCSVVHFQNKNSQKKMSISFGSVYENEKLTLLINDSIYYSNRPIKTNSLGTDPTNYIEIDTDSINLKGTFRALIDTELNIKRTLEIDTVLYRSKGWNIIIGANYDKYYVSQQNKLFIVE